MSRCSDIRHTSVGFEPFWRVMRRLYAQLCLHLETQWWPSPEFSPSGRKQREPGRAVRQQTVATWVRRIVEKLRPVTRPGSPCERKRNLNGMCGT